MYVDVRRILFFDDSAGGTARMEVFGNGFPDIGRHNAPGVSIGSLARVKTYRETPEGQCL